MTPFHDHLVQAVTRLSMADLLASETHKNKYSWCYNHSLIPLKLDWKAGLRWFYLKRLSHLEGEGTPLLANFFQKGFLHCCSRNTFICGWINLNVLDPNVSPEGEPDDVQVFTSITKGTSEVDKYCSGKWCITPHQLISEPVLDDVVSNTKVPFLPLRPDGSTLTMPSVKRKKKQSNLFEFYKNSFKWKGLKSTHRLRLQNPRGLHSLFSPSTGQSTRNEAKLLRL